MTERREHAGTGRLPCAQSREMWDSARKWPEVWDSYSHARGVMNMNRRSVTDVDGRKRYGHGPAERYGHGPAERYGRERAQALRTRTGWGVANGKGRGRYGREPAHL